MRDRWPGQRCVIVGGAGAVGAMLAGRLADQGTDVCIVDLALPDEAGHRGDITAMSPGLAANLGRADVVVLAVPEAVALAAFPAVARAMASGALLVNTLSVQGRIAAAGGQHAGHLELLGLNPMFAPSLDPRGRAVAAVVGRDGPRVRAVLDVVASWGARIVRVSADEHDRLAAAAQALTHAAILAFGMALTQMLGTVPADSGTRLDIAALAAIAPPPHATMLALLARIASGTPEVYWEVQAGNPQAALARRALSTGVRRLADLIEAGQPAFTAGLQELRDLLGEELEPRRDLCQTIFDRTACVGAS